MAEFQIGDRVLILGEVIDQMTHHNGVVGVRVRFNGVERFLVVPDSIIQPASLLEMATAFCVVPYEPGGRVREIQVIRRSSDPDTWAIVREGHCLGHDGEWEFEPMPLSSRTEEFFQRCRWTSAMEAIAFIQEHLRRYPTGDREDAEKG